jgi:16S rRNA (cytosine1402-N4)-methyltransferase
MKHEPVLLNEVLSFWHWKKGGFYIDGTLGLGGHSEALLAVDSKARCLGIDRDSQAVQLAQERLKQYGGRAMIRHANYKDLIEIIKKEKLGTADGILLDLGVSSMQLDQAERGFSFRKQGPLDMRMDPSQGPTVLDLIHRLSPAELAEIIQRYGEEKKAKVIAVALKNAESKHELSDTIKCAEIISAAVGGRFQSGKGRIHPATKTFQALRIALNQELQSLEIFLESLPDLLNPSGRALLISFHSLEDRIIKNKIRQWVKGCLCPPSFPKCVCGKFPVFRELNRKPVTASAEEIRLNPRSRSAKLRVVEKL